MPRGRPIKPRDESRERTAPAVEWSRRPEFQPFGHRLDFLSPEKQHLNTGNMRIMPPLHPEKREGKKVKK